MRHHHKIIAVLGLGLLLVNFSAQANTLNARQIITTKVNNCEGFQKYFKFKNTLSDNRRADYIRSTSISVPAEYYGVKTSLPALAAINQGNSPTFSFAFVDQNKAILPGQVVTPRGNGFASLCGIVMGCYHDSGENSYVAYLELVGDLESCNFDGYTSGSATDPYVVLLK